MAQYLEMSKTTFSNSHGLADWKNRSTSCDLAKLAINCMKHSLKFRTIASTKEYEAKIFNKNTKMIRVEKWTNSNIGLFEQ